MDVLKSYFVLACVAFVVGFAGYWSLAGAFAAAASPAAPVFEAPASAALSAFEGNPGKRI